VLLSNRENLSLDGRHALKKLLAANRRLNTACLLKESFGQLWDYRSERGARAFFERWQDALKWTLPERDSHPLELSTLLGRTPLFYLNTYEHQSK
jgi:hypothetical protein